MLPSQSVNQSITLTLECSFHVHLWGLWIVSQQCVHGHDNARCTEPTLWSMRLGYALLSQESFYLQNYFYETFSKLVAFPAQNIVVICLPLPGPIVWTNTTSHPYRVGHQLSFFQTRHMVLHRCELALLTFSIGTTFWTIHWNLHRLQQQGYTSTDISTTTDDTMMLQLHRYTACS